VKFAHDILHDNDEIVTSQDWDRIPDFETIRECRNFISVNNDRDLCTYWPTEGSILPIPGDLGVWKKPTNRELLLEPDYTCNRNISAEMGDAGKVTEENITETWDGKAELQIRDDLENGIHRQAIYV
jgi:hypothetical protein